MQQKTKEEKEELVQLYKQSGMSVVLPPNIVTTWKESFSTDKLKEGRKMKKRFSEEQIVKMIQEHKQGKSVSEISREYGIAEQTFYKHC